MRFPARIFFSLLFVISCLLLVAPHSANAQNPSGNSFNTPNMDPDVPKNQHTYAQSVTIEVLSAINCILTGIDIIDPTQGCLGINPETKRLGVSKPQLDEYNRPEVTGLLGATTGLIAQTFEPVASTATYTQYLSENFGIVDKAYAQSSACDPAKSGYGVCGLRPILQLWETTRNIAYVLLTLAFIMLGIGIMLRIKIDPRTVMTIQNQIPKAIISIILVTLSYGIAALMIDTMWVTTYAGSYLLTQKHDPDVGDCEDKKAPEKLSKKISTDIIQTPITFFNQVFARCSDENNVGFLPQNDRDGGFHVMTRTVANNAGETIANIAKSLIFDKDDLEAKCAWYNPIKCVKRGMVGIVSTIISAAVLIIIFVTLVIALFKIWFNLLKAFIYTLLYIIVAPVMIVFGLLPSKPMGFENWLRRLFVNVAIFPITAWLFVIARLLMDLYDKDAPNQFIPPLIGNPSSANFGVFLAFGVIIITPHIQVILQEKMGVKGIGSPGLVGAGVAAGAAVVGGPAGRASKHLNRRDQRGQASGMLSVAKEKAGNRALGIAAKWHVPLTSKALDTRLKKQNNPSGYHTTFGAEDEHGLKSEKGQELIKKGRFGNWNEQRKNRKKGNNGPESAPGGAPSGGPSSGGPAGGGATSKPKWWQIKKKRNGGSSASEGGSPNPSRQGTTTVNAGTVVINAGNIRGLSPEVGQHLDRKPEHAGHIQAEFARASVGKSFEGKTIEEISALPKEHITRKSAEATLKAILERTKNNPPTT